MQKSFHQSITGVLTQEANMLHSVSSTVGTHFFLVLSPCCESAITQHEPSCRLHSSKVVPRGLEPRTLRLLAVRSNQLSYETIDGYAVTDSSTCEFQCSTCEKGRNVQKRRA